MKVENQAGCSVLDKLQGFDGVGGESSQQRVAVVQTGEDKCLDYNLCNFLCEVRLYYTDVVDHEPAGAGHCFAACGDQQAVKGHAKVLCPLGGRLCGVVNRDGEVFERPGWCNRSEMAS